MTAGLGDDTLSWVMNLEKLWEDYPLPEGSEADFALRVEGDELEPYVRPGGIALIKRGAEIRDGDVGLFFAAATWCCGSIARTGLGMSISLR